LKSTSNLDQVKDLSKRLELNLSHDPFYSGLAFDHILTSSYSLACEFLLDPSLNPPAARNCSRIITYLKENVAGKEQRKALLRAVFKGFSVGLVRREEAQSILRDLPDIMIASKDGPVTARNTPKINIYYSAILKSLTKCNVFSTRDLGVDIMNAWIGHVKQMPCDRYAAKLILSLTKSVSFSQATEKLKSDSRAFHVLMSHVEITTTTHLTKRWLEYLCEQPTRREHHLRHLACFLGHLSPGVLSSVVIEIPNYLIVSIRNDKLSPEVLLLWEQVLLLFDKEIVMSVLRKNSIWTQKINGTDAGLPADAQLVLRLWTALILCNGAENPSHVFKQMDFPSQLRDHFNEHDPALLWNHILKTLHSLPKLRFRGQLFDFLNKIHESQPARDVIRTAGQQAVLDAFAAQGFAILQDDKTYLHALHYLNDPLKQLAESVNKDIAGFAGIVLPLIARDKLSLRIVTRLLKHNNMFHFALVNYWSLHSGMDTNGAKLSDPSTSVSRLTELAVLLKASGDKNFHESVLNFMHDLAIAFAFSPALSNRQALRKVFWCFNFLHRYGAPIHSPITKALWYAGVTRCEGGGTARRVVLWLLRKVREVEGPATVESLTTSGDFRAKRAMEVWNWGRRLCEGLPRDAEDVADYRAIPRDEDKHFADEKALFRDEEGLLQMSRSNDMDENRLAQDIWGNNRRRPKGFESDTGWVCRLHASAPRSWFVK
jgi:hypothetical protein